MSVNPSASYHLGRPSRHRRRWLVVAAGMLLALIVAGSVYVTQHTLRSNTSLTHSPGIVSVVTVSKTATQTVATPEFSLTIPQNWKAVMPTSSRYHVYSWRGTTTEDSVRSLDVYVDTIPVNLYLNHMLPLKAVDNRVTMLDGVSDNCANFSTSPTEAPKPDHVKAKWAGVDFWCDLANYARDVVGTSSAEGINTVSVKGPSGTHSYFFVYTDNASSPDYSIFTSAVQSFAAR